MVSCADTSFLFSLYGNDVHSTRALAWTKVQHAPLTITSLAEYELGNALRFAEFRKSLLPGKAALFWGDFKADLLGGRVRLEICNLADVVEQAKKLSERYTLQSGHRGFDILHVAAALIVEADCFLSFDENQRKLALAEGLHVPL